MNNIERVPEPFDFYARQMFEAIIAVTALPNSEGKDRLLSGLSHIVYRLGNPLVIMTATKIKNT